MRFDFWRDDKYKEEAAFLKQLIEFILKNGDSIFVEIDKPLPEGGVVPATRAGEIVAKAGRSFEAALEKIKPAAEAIITQLIDLSRKPDKIEVEFGVRLSADAGAIIASTGAEANFKVTLSWNQKG
jgi:hypothetical protein